MSPRPADIPGVMLDDTFVLGWRLDGGRLVFDVVASLQPGHPSYAPPPPLEWACYRRGQSIFEGARDVRGLKPMSDVRPTIDPDGSADYETFDSISQSDGQFVVCGEFGDVELAATSVRLVVADSG